MCMGMCVMCVGTVMCVGMCDVCGYEYVQCVSVSACNVCL